MRDKLIALGIWVAALIACGVMASRTMIATDMAAFLPRSSSVAQQALTDQVSHGAASHLVLVAISGVTPKVMAALSRNMAAQLRTEPEFIDIANGDENSFKGVRNFIWHQRYLLSADMTAAHFTAAGLHAALQNDLALLGSDMGGLLQSSLASDPTGELLTLISKLQPSSGPRSVDGVWVSPDASKALLLVHTTAPGFDIDGQQRALTLIQNAFANAKATLPQSGNARLRETGPGVFAVQIRNTTKSDVTRLSMLASAGAVALLLFAYRSPLVLVLGLLPVASGALAAIAAVSLDFGFVHGVTLGFGVTLIGESIDYAIYLFTQAEPGETAGTTLARIWPTLRLGAATSIIGFSAMLFSNFVGFAQLGLFSIIGLATAACVTRFVLPNLMPRGFFAPGSLILAKPLLGVIARRSWLRPCLGFIVLVASTTLALHRGGIWDGNLQNLSPIPAAAQELDQSLRADLGVANLRYFVVLQADSEQHALQASEALAQILQNLVARHELRGFDLPSEILPSERTQRARQLALPNTTNLQANFTQAMVGLPFRTEYFKSFFADIAQARTAPLITQASLPPALALQLQSTLVQGRDGWTVLAPLRGVTNPAGIAASFAAAPVAGVQFVDLDHESAQLLHTFQADATKLAIIGCAAIISVLLIGLRSPGRVVRVAAPLAASVIVTAAVLTMHHGKLSIFMVVGFLLIVAVGSNYCLFFERLAHDDGVKNRAIASVMLANLCTVSAYGLMSLSHIPVLHDIGLTVAIGTFLSLFFGAVLSTPPVALVA